jgi:CRISPR-associated protein (TIGR02584 family)
MSPAVLTETVWALAHPTDGSQPVIPDLVVVVTTAAGRQAIERELLSSAAPASETSPAAPSVWEQLRAAVLGAAHSRDPRLILQPPRIIEAPNRRSGHADWLDDIQTPEQNEAAADFILEEVRRIAFNDDTMLVASLAGGRKTMGALLYAALSLLGRPQDRLTHVLVNEPFDHPALRPRFYFPHPPETSYRLEGRDGRATEHSSRSARLQLADVPFVRLRRLFPSQLGRWPGRFSDLVRHYSEQLDRLAGPPSVQLDHSKLQVRVNDVPVGLTVREFAIFAFLAERCRDGHAAYAKQNMALTDFAAWLTRWATRFDPFTPQRAVADGWKKPEDDDLRRQLSEVRKKFRMAGLGRFESFLLPTRGSFGVRVLLSA